MNRIQRSSANSVVMRKYAAALRLRVVLWSAPIVLAMLSSGCGVKGPYVWVHELPSDYFVVSPVEVIEKGDAVNIRVFGQEAISTRMKVRPTGTITIPLVGEVVAAGKEPAALAKELQERLQPFVTMANVVVTIDESQIRVDMVGEIVRKGSLNMERPCGVLAAIANAGGMTEFASDDRIFVLRPDKAGQLRRIRFRYGSLLRGEAASTAFRLKTGDTIVVE